tara:strand:+ start:1164 stop:1340 length:177 start_codon:yes stop_codon:yes gene_type:complete
MPMYKGQKYEYDKEGLRAYHAKKEKDALMKNITLTDKEKKAKKAYELKNKLKGPLQEK